MLRPAEVLTTISAPSGETAKSLIAAAQGHLVAAGALRQVPEDPDRRFAVHPCGAWVRIFA
jgi:hypothetical protein